MTDQEKSVKPLLLQGGTIIDGSGSAPYHADMLICGRHIEAIGENLPVPEYAEIIDVAGMAVTPGFIDMHRHCDIAVLTDPAFGAVELAQGITSTVVGNCGLAPVPCDPKGKEALDAFLSPVIGPMPDSMCFTSYAKYVAALEQAPLPLHIGFLAGTGAIRTAVNGFSPAPLTDAQLSQAHALLAEALLAGALGASMGLAYPPECHATQEGMLALLEPLKDRDVLLCAHIRGEGDSLVASVDEAIALARALGMRLNISHFKATGRPNWQRTLHKAIDHIETARAQGQPVTVDFYPYAASATTMISLLPPSLMQTDQAATLRRLATTEGKRALRDAIYREVPGWDNLVCSIGWERILVGSVTLAEHMSMQGKDMRSLADSLGIADPADLLCDLLASEEGRVGALLMSMDPADVDTIARLSYSAVISDALYGGGANPHPRLYGSQPRILRDFVRERHILTLPDAIHKMTAMPAERLRLVKRGRLLPGYVADINVFDPNLVADHATFAHSAQRATGMHLTLVNGRPAQAAANGTVLLADQQ